MRRSTMWRERAKRHRPTADASGWARVARRGRPWRIADAGALVCEKRRVRSSSSVSTSSEDLRRRRPRDECRAPRAPPAPASRGRQEYRFRRPPGSGSGVEIGETHESRRKPAVCVGGVGSGGWGCVSTSAVSVSSAGITSSSAGQMVERSHEATDVTRARRLKVDPKTTDAAPRKSTSQACLGQTRARYVRGRLARVAHDFGASEPRVGVSSVRIGRVTQEASASGTATRVFRRQLPARHGIGGGRAR